MDTNSNPDGIDFPIPGNDDARRSIDLYCSLLKETILNAKKDSPQTVTEEKNIETINSEVSNNEVENKIN
jgi:small subunit ribosomal protein S2